VTIHSRPTAVVAVVAAVAAVAVDAVDAAAVVESFVELVSVCPGVVEDIAADCELSTTLYFPYF